MMQPGAVAGAYDPEMMSARLGVYKVGLFELSCRPLTFPLMPQDRAICEA